MDFSSFLQNLGNTAQIGQSQRLAEANAQAAELGVQERQAQLARTERVRQQEEEARVRQQQMSAGLSQAFTSYQSSQQDGKARKDLAIDLGKVSAMFGDHKGVQEAGRMLNEIQQEDALSAKELADRTLASQKKAAIAAKAFTTDPTERNFALFADAATEAGMKIGDVTWDRPDALTLANQAIDTADGTGKFIADYYRAQAQKQKAKDAAAAQAQKLEADLEAQRMRARAQAEADARKAALERLKNAGKAEVARINADAKVDVAVQKGENSKTWKQQQFEAEQAEGEAARAAVAKELGIPLDQVNGLPKNIYEKKAVDSVTSIVGEFDQQFTKMTELTFGTGASPFSDHGTKLQEDLVNMGTRSITPTESQIMTATAAGMGRMVSVLESGGMSRSAAQAMIKELQKASAPTAGDTVWTMMYKLANLRDILVGRLNTLKTPIDKALAVKVAKIWKKFNNIPSGSDIIKWAKAANYQMPANLVSGTYQQVLGELKGQANVPSSPDKPATAPPARTGGISAPPAGFTPIK